MKRLIAITMILAASTGGAFAVPNGCNKAVQNWNNGSGITCPPGNQENVRNPQQPVLEVGPEIPSTNCAATTGCGSAETVT